MCIIFIRVFSPPSLIEAVSPDPAGDERRMLRVSGEEREPICASMAWNRLRMRSVRKKRAEENPDSAPESPEEQMRMAKLREKQEKSRLLRTFKQRKALDDPSIDSKQGMMSLDMIKSLFGNPIKKKSEVGIFQ